MKASRLKRPARERMPAVDTAWYRMEESLDPVDIGALLTFAGPIDYPTMCRLLEARLLRYRRFRQRVVDRRLRVRAPRWEDDPEFSLGNHLHALTLPSPGTHEQLEELVGELMSVPLSFDHSPWQMYLIDNVDGGSALVARFHHCMGDGFALGHLLLAVADDAPPPPPSPQTAPPTKPSAQSGGRARLAGRAAGSLARLTLLPFDPDTYLRSTLVGVRRVAWSGAIPLAWIKAIGRGLGGATVNDVLISALTGSIRRYLEAHGEPVDRLHVRVIVPVNLRPVRRIEEMGDDLGNRFGLVFLDLPVHARDPARRMALLKRAMDRLKASPEAVVAFGLLGVLGRAPMVVERSIRALFARKASVVATNVPGPREALHFAGTRLRDVVFWVPHPARLGLGLSIFSYDGCVRIGVRSDVAAVARPRDLVETFEAELAALAREAGVERDAGGSPREAGGESSP